MKRRRLFAGLAVVILAAVISPLAARAESMPGLITGQITNSDGSPAAFASVNGYAADTGVFFFANADENGSYSSVADPGTYVVDVSTEAQHQYFHGATDPADADPITVIENGTTVADEQLLPTGAVVLTVTNIRTGQAIPDFCASISNGGGSQSDCAHGTGGVTFGRVTALPSSVFVQADGYLSLRQDAVPVTAGATTPLALALTPAGSIDVDIVDRATSAPLGSTCIQIRPRGLAHVGGPFIGGACTDEGSGHVTITELAAGTYDLFATVFDDVHGWQWVGSTGGVGREELAAQVVVVEGQSTIAPTVKLDKAGSVEGTITDAATGQPIPGACVSALPVSIDPSGEPGPRACADDTGHYRLDGLGPYNWPLEVSQPSFGSTAEYAWHWGGNRSPNRFSGAPTKINAGKLVTFNPTMVRGGILTGVVLDNAGNPVADADVFVTNSTTGDMAAGWVRTDVTGHFTFAAVLGQSVRIGVGTSLHDWYAKKTSWGTATKVTVTNGLTKTVTVRLL